MKVTSQTLGMASLETPSADATGARSQHSMGGPAGNGRPQLAARGRLRTAGIGLVSVAEDVIHYGVALVLIIVAGVVLCETTYDLATTHQPFAAAATTAVNGSSRSSSWRSCAP
jgi:hypothetical protein